MRPASVRATTVAAPVALVALVLAAPAARAQPLFQIRTTTLNRVGLTLSNYGFYGNNFISRSPSCEYPLGLGMEHMSRAGLWVGALAITDQGEEFRVTTGAVDNQQGSNQVADTEWSPRPGGIVERSNLINSRVFRPDAVSEQDFVTVYSDEEVRGGGGIVTEPHVPLRVRVDQEIYSFSIEPASHFVILHLEITNEGNLLRDVYAGLYTQLVSGNKNLYSTWPPSANSGPGSWYFRHYVDYVDSLRLVREHICDMLTPPAEPEACVNFDSNPFWAGVKLLGVEPDGLAGKDVSFRLWNWSPGDTARDEDVERYRLMSAGVVDPPHVPSGGQFSPIELLSVGPFPLIPPDSTITVDFAFVFGEDREALAVNAEFAQFAFDLDFRLPAPPPSPRLHARPGANRLTLLWDDSPERVVDDTSPLPGGMDFQGYRVYFGGDRNALDLVAQFDVVDTAGFNTGFGAIRLAEPEVIEGDTVRYAYSIEGLRDGFTHFTAVTAFDTGDEQVPPLESGISQNKKQIATGPRPGGNGRGVTAFPNPYKVDARWDAGSLARDQYLWFANLPRRCKLTIFTLAGDKVFEVEFDGDVYHGANARGFFDPRADLDVSAPDLSGGMFAWNLITREGQAAATGLYIWTVQDRETQEVQRGKLLLLKSDREGF